MAALNYSHQARNACAQQQYRYCHPGLGPCEQHCQGWPPASRQARRAPVRRLAPLARSLAGCADHSAPSWCHHPCAADRVGYWCRYRLPHKPRPGRGVLVSRLRCAVRCARHNCASRRADHDCPTNNPLAAVGQHYRRPGRRASRKADTFLEHKQRRPANYHRGDKDQAPDCSAAPIPGRYRASPA